MRVCPGVGVVVFSDFFSDSPGRAVAPRLMAAGARGLVPKDAPPDVLVRAVASGGWFVQGPAGAPRFEGLRCLARAGPLDGPVPKLTPRDQGVLRLIVCGLTDAQIARTLHVATPTVKNQLRKLYQRLAARHRAQAVARAVVLGLLEEGL